jgi:hypothetical protein
MTEFKQDIFLGTIRQFAEAVLARDESQVMYYKNRIKEMVLLDLSKQDIVTRELAGICYE